MVGFQTYRHTLTINNNKERKYVICEFYTDKINSIDHSQKKKEKFMDVISNTEQSS